MGRSLHLGRIAGIAIELDYTWFVIYILVAVSLALAVFPSALPAAPAWMNWLLGLITAVLFFASVLAHELMHSVVARREGLDVSSISLFIFGGVSRITEEPRTPGAEARMAAAGPLTSLVLAALLYGIALWGRALGWGPVFTLPVSWLAMINLLLGIFNLVPGLPLDGGRLLRAAVWYSTHNLARATRIAAGIGQGFGYLLIFFGVLFVVGGDLLGLWWVLIGWFLAQAAAGSYQQVMLQRALSGIPVERLMTRDVVSVPAGMSLADLVETHFLNRPYSAYPVQGSDGELLGVVTVGDVRAVPRERWGQVSTGEVAEPLSEDLIISPQADSWDALLKMAAGNRARLLVTQDHHLVGIISQSNVMELLRTRMDLNVGR